MSEIELPEITVNDVERAIQILLNQGVPQNVGHGTTAWAVYVVITAAGYWLADETAYLGCCGVSEVVSELQEAA